MINIGWIPLIIIITGLYMLIGETVYRVDTIITFADFVIFSIVAGIVFIGGYLVGRD